MEEMREIEATLKVATNKKEKKSHNKTSTINKERKKERNSSNNVE
jgi:hypothetical protein